MADFNKRGPGCDDDCDSGENGERGKRGRRGHRGHDGRDGKDGRDGRDGFPIVTDPTPPTLRGDGSPENPLQVINVAPEPFVHPPEIRTIFVRSTGNDENDGMTPETALRTVQAAALLVPLFIPGGAYYVIDATGLVDGGPEILPPNYELPSYRSGRTLVLVEPDRGAVTLRADLRDVPDLGSDAVIELGDLESTDVGGPIVSASNTAPIVITTTVPHNLVQSPIGIFGVFAGVVQVVEISGVVGNPEANGVFLALVTKPTVDESTTFELYDFDLNPVAGSGAGAGGTVTVLFVKDQFSGQTQIKVSTSRASWIADGADTLKGKLLVGSGDSAVIYANTDDTLFLASNGEPGIFDGPVRIVEPSCVLQCSESEVFNDPTFIGGLNIVNVDSICLSGIEVRAASDGSGLFQSGGVSLISECVLEAPRFGLQGRTFTEQSHLIGPFYNLVSIDQDRCLVENMLGIFAGYWSAFHGTVIIQDETPLPSDSGIGIDGTIDWVLGVKMISAADPVFLLDHTGGVRMYSVSIEGGTGDAIVIRWPGDNQLFNVGGSGWTGRALVVDSGAQVEVDAFTFGNGNANEVMQVGLSPNSLGERSFADFRTGDDGCPQRQQGDITSVGPCGYLGTASRVFQRDS